MIREPEDPGKAGRWAKKIRLERGWSAGQMAERINGLAQLEGDTTKVSQQVVSKFEQGDTKRKPAWVRYIAKVVEAANEETGADPYLTTARVDRSVGIKLLPTFAGMGQGGTGDDDEGVVSFSRDLVENDLRAPPEALLAMVAEGNSMEPDFRGGDQILVDTRRRTLAQPGAFCLWEDDGHVIKFLERIPDTDPIRIRVVSLNPLYEPRERLLDDVRLVGRVVWFGRRVQ